MYFVAGATGNVGSQVVRKLSESGVGVKAQTRSSTGGKVAELQRLPGVEIVACDLMDKAGLAEALQGVKAVFLVCGNAKEQAQMEINVIDAAVAAGCTYLVENGTHAGYTNKDSPVEFGRHHWEIEEHLAKSAGAMKWTVLHANWFMSNHLGDIFGTLPNGAIVYPLKPEDKAQLVDPRDVGDIAAQMLLDSDPSKYHGLHLMISGPDVLTWSQIAALYTEELGRPIEMATCSEPEWVAAAIKGSGFEHWLAEAAAHNFKVIRDGGFLHTTSPQLLALAPPRRTMKEWIAEWAPRSPPPPAAQ
ncbi:hypothetical protein EMIHUDRAFT_445796 [Emiliania huxleyi CCMP1516]|uniref:NmrA-like domain-containing protein n=2 Tax=Emiliania huxleyi TaxID=2903 RepID=A0A0D3IR16_EMIH1|nr:hypothetical protein EMIHUDRAFT_445796 [Emiliania huxleyi CCMP1516]EOD13701.1 hypothetical protein EMIHUDRAFT_445796 [Emiliania huxleyi CCMP1516]|mmetsp:Transcript_1664/g.4930  ORF Transcript_1664/g.4930 Transcript_1664/m.4930 type:complete len:303 (+) Transcript_1664:64-972(+)|eukprot:XP_005766130.1 hypothetical protein EMIHUDRAFT_445796 [Emiliania huxleyi CCMP1516]